MAIVEIGHAFDQCFVSFHWISPSWTAWVRPRRWLLVAGYLAAYWLWISSLANFPCTRANRTGTSKCLPTWFPELPFASTSSLIACSFSYMYKFPQNDFPKIKLKLIKLYCIAIAIFDKLAIGSTLSRRYPAQSLKFLAPKLRLEIGTLPLQRQRVHG